MSVSNRKGKMKKIILAIVLAIFLIPGVIYADKVHLNNPQKIPSLDAMHIEIIEIEMA